MAIVWPQRVSYNNGVAEFGGLTASFSRDSISNGIPVDTRRFSEFPMPVSPVLEWSSGLTLPSGAGVVRGAGPDRDGTPLIALPASQVLYIYSWDGSTFQEESSTSYTEFPLADATISYTVSSVSIFYGFIVANLSYYESGVELAVALIYSQDRGETWSLVESTEGGFHIPPLSGGVTDGMNRGSVFTRPSIFPYGGLGSDGSHSKLSAVVTGVDYINAVNVPKGGQAYRFDITRNTEDDVFDVGKVRVINELWDAGLVQDHHFHTCGVIFDEITELPYIIIFKGDGSQNNHATLVEFGSSNYETAILSTTDEWHGTLDTSPSRDHNQPTSAVPAPGNRILASGDLTVGSVQRWSISESGDPITEDMVQLYLDSTTGIFFDCPDPLNLVWYPDVGYFGGRNPPNVGGPHHFSHDGEIWTYVMDDVSLDESPGYGSLIESKLLRYDASTSELMVSDLPTPRNSRPLILNPGSENIATEVSLRTSPIGSNTYAEVAYSSIDGYTYVSDGSPVPDAPTTPPPRENAFLMEVEYADASSSRGPIMWLQGGSDSIDATVPMHLDVWFFNMSDDRSSRMFFDYGNSTSFSEKADERGFTCSTSRTWYSLHRSGVAKSLPAVNPARALTGRLSGGVGITSPSGARTLIAIDGLYSGDAPFPYPSDVGDSSPPPEIESISNLSSVSAWSFAATIRRQFISNTTDMPLFTIFAADNNRVEVTWDQSAEEVVITPVVSGTPGTSTTFSVGEWGRLFPLHIMISQNGSGDLGMTVASVDERIVHNDDIGGGLSEQPSSIQFSNAAGDEVGHIEVFGCGFIPEALSEAQREAEVKDLTYLNMAFPGGSMMSNAQNSHDEDD